MTVHINPTTETMSAVVTRAGGSIEGSGSLVDSAIPAPGRPAGRDLLVRISAVSVNPVDVKVRASGGDAERVLGWDASGTVVAVGEDATLFEPGDEVYYAGALTRPGSYAEQQLVDERIVGRKPASLTHAEAAALPLTAITAWESLFDKLRLDASSTGTLLVLGAAGGVGSILIQLAKALTGVRVIASASRAESRGWAEAMGADAVVDHSADDLAAQILALAPEGVDYVFTPQSAGRMDLFAEVARPFGEIVGIDDPSDLDLMALKGKALTWHWEMMFARSLHGYDPIAQHRLLDRVAELVDADVLRTTLTKTLTPINADTLREAHRLVETGRVVGKIVVAEG